MSSKIFMGRKAALDLSVGFLVKLILAIVVFSFGMIIVRNIFSSAGSGDLTRGIDAEIEQQIRVLMDSGEKIIIFPEEIETSRNRVAVFGLGVLNVLNRPGETEFNVNVNCHSFIPRSSEELRECPPESASWTFDNYPPLSILNNDEDTLSIAVLPNSADAGVYVYNVIVRYGDDDELYGITKFRVIVR